MNQIFSPAASIRAMVPFFLLFRTCAYAGYGDPVSNYPDFPSCYERQIIVLTNACRMDPAGFRQTFLTGYSILDTTKYPRVGPVYWCIEINRSARAHSIDMANTCGLVHASCNGTTWDAHIKSYYTRSPSLSENIACSRTTALATMQQWLMDGNPPAGDLTKDAEGNRLDGHRYNIMNGAYREMGSGYAYGTVQPRYFWTQDFGGAVSQYAGSRIPAGSHFLLETGTTTTTFIADYYDASGKAPAKTQVVIDGGAHDMTLWMGSAARGTYRFADPKAGACQNYYFSFIDGSGNVAQYPETGSLVTYGEGTCTQDYIATRQATCTDCGIVRIPALFQGLVRCVKGTQVTISASGEGMRIAIINAQGRTIGRYQSGRAEIAISLPGTGVYGAIIMDSKGSRIRSRLVVVE